MGLKGVNTKKSIIEKSAELLLKKGYNAMSISDILEAVGIPKGSFYFHFKSKKELGLSICDYFYNEIKNWFLEISKDKNTWDEFINSLMISMLDKFEKKEYFGCPFSIFGQEISLVEPEIRERCGNAIEDLGKLFSMLLIKYGIEEKRAKEVGLEALSCYEGYLVYFRLTWDKNAISLMGKALINMYNQERR